MQVRGSGIIAPHNQQHQLCIMASSTYTRVHESVIRARLDNRVQIRLGGTSSHRRFDGRTLRALDGGRVPVMTRSSARRYSPSHQLGWCAHEARYNCACLCGDSWALYFTAILEHVKCSMRVMHYTCNEMLLPNKNLMFKLTPVSYTHLTLPTIYSV